MFGGGLPVISTNRKPDRKMSGRPFIQRAGRCHTNLKHECAMNAVYAVEEECIHDDSVGI